MFNAQLEESDEPAVLPTFTRRAREQADHLAPELYRKEKYRIGSDDDDGDEASSESESGIGSEEDGEYEYASDALTSSDEDQEFGEAGSVFTMVEMRALAKHIASVSGWKDLRTHDRWDGFCDQVRLPLPLFFPGEGVMR